MSRLINGQVLIVGYAMTGKTTISEFFDNVVHTDDYIGSEKDIEIPEHGCIEGIYGFDMLRGGFEPDVVIRMLPEFEALPKHRAQRKACDTKWNQWLTRKPDVEIIQMTKSSLSLILKLEQMIDG